jgi:hypothetical protein
LNNVSVLSINACLVRDGGEIATTSFITKLIPSGYSDQFLLSVLPEFAQSHCEFNLITAALDARIDPSMLHGLPEFEQVLAVPT